jgi:hypothetical protein
MSEDQDNENVVNIIWEKQREADGNRALKLYKVSGFPAFAPMTKDEKQIRDWTR